MIAATISLSVGNFKEKPKLEDLVHFFLLQLPWNQNPSRKRK